MEALTEGNIIGDDPFQITAFDSSGNALGSWQLPATGSGEFVGIVSDTSNISRLNVSAISYNASTLLEVGPLELQDSPSVASVPALPA